MKAGLYNALLVWAGASRRLWGGGEGVGSPCVVEDEFESDVLACILSYTQSSYSVQYFIYWAKVFLEEWGFCLARRTDL